MTPSVRTTLTMWCANIRSLLLCLMDMVMAHPQRIVLTQIELKSKWQRYTSGSTVMNVKKEAFLSNKNKQSFIIQLSAFLRQKGDPIIHARDDADELMVQTASQSVSIVNTVVIGDDTDLLILLYHHMPIDSAHEGYIMPEAKSGTYKVPRCWNIKLISVKTSHWPCSYRMWPNIKSVWYWQRCQRFLCSPPDTFSNICSSHLLYNIEYSNYRHGKEISCHLPTGIGYYWVQTSFRW